VVDEDRQLPVIEDRSDEEAPVCSPTNYVSNEEAALFAAMRGLREQSVVLRRDLKDAGPKDRASLEAELERLREEWQTLAERRERAYVNKMIMLGHLPPNHPTE
jgi:DNA repair exonuclease SbcCD ATPase subunit